MSRSQVCDFWVFPFKGKARVIYFPIPLSSGWRAGVVVSRLHQADSDNPLVVAEKQGGRSLGPQYPRTSIPGLEHIPQLLQNSFYLAYHYILRSCVRGV